MVTSLTTNTQKLKLAFTLQSHNAMDKVEREKPSKLFIYLLLIVNFDKFIVRLYFFIIYFMLVKF